LFFTGIEVRNGNGLEFVVVPWVTCGLMKYDDHIPRGARSEEIA
jgi:hypothetical protein